MSQLETNGSTLTLLNETTLPSIIEKINSLPDASGGTTVEIVEVTVRRSSSPTGSNYVNTIYHVNVDSNGLLIVGTATARTYLSYHNCVSNTLLFIATQNSPSTCTVSGNLELINFNSSVGAVIKVIGSDANAGIATVSDPGDLGGGEDSGISSLTGAVNFR